MPDLFDFAESVNQMSTPGAVCAELLSHTEPHGFFIYAIGAVPHPETPYPTRFMVSNWPQSWHAAYYERQFGDRDPTLRAMKGHGRPFSITDLRRGKCGFLPTSGELEMLDFAASIGSPEGFLVPIFRANGYAGFSCLSGGGPDPSPAVRARLQFLLEHAHDRLRTLAAYHDAGGAGPPLTRREIEVLSLSRRGLGDAEIARVSGISVRTVRFHFENARHKLAAHSRTEAIAIAVGRHLLPA
ncbi:MAG: autoinducer binding domain-containing protein [Rhodobacteraceae bacterium]|nr:autoinducer binding domain-containing protein [Paracoccaceae bacterium]